MKVQDILKEKGTKVHTVTPEVSVYDALNIMAEHNLGSLIVLSENKIIGIFTERDYARKVILKGKFSKDITVLEVMHGNPITVTEDTSIEDCMNIMTHKYLRHLPVKKDGELIGLISIGDVVKAIINEQKFIIENLDHYISGSK